MPDAEDKITFRWSTKYASLFAMLASAATFCLSHYVESSLIQRRAEDRIEILEKTMVEVRAIQALNTEARVRQQTLIEGNADMLRQLQVGQKDLEKLIQQHEQHTRTALRQHGLENP